MSVYFSYFPKIQYKGRNVIDITKRTNFIADHLSDPLLFLPYTVTEDDKAEDIAHYYYGSTDYVWLILLANKMTDPYTDWIMSEKQLQKYIQNKYYEKSGKSKDVVAWSQNETIVDNILWFERDEGTVSVDTVLIESVSAEDISMVQTSEGRQAIFSGFIDTQRNRPIRVYDYETILNENKRQIVLVDKKYTSKIEEEFYRLMRE